MSGSKRQRVAIAATVLAAGFLPWLLSAIGLFLSLWIVVPAPTAWLLPLGVGAPEVSPWLLVLNAIALVAVGLHLSHGWPMAIALGVSLVSLALSALPVAQLPAAHQQMTAAMQTLGAAYLQAVPAARQAQWRSQPFRWVDAWRGLPLPEVREDRAIEFARPEGVPLTLTLYRPLAVGPHPTIVVIHGGAWRSGSPDQDADFNRYMAAQGYTVIAISYRLAPRYPFPAQRTDVESALAFIRDRAPELEVNLSRVALMGRSAGAQLAMLAAYQPSPLPVVAVVNYYGPVELATGYRDVPVPDPIDTRAILRDFLGGTPDEVPERYREASPYTYATRVLPRTLLVYAGRDHIVQAKFGRALFEQLQRVGSPAVFLEIPWAEHAFDAVFNGVSNQLALYHTERFLAGALAD